MKFKISGIPEIPFENETKFPYKVITVYAVGNLEIKTEIEKKIKYFKHKKYNAYLIPISELNKLYELILTINGKPGDLINVGSDFQNGFDSVSNKTISANGRLTFGYLKKYIKQADCFKGDSDSINDYLLSEIENPFLIIRYFVGKEKGINMICVLLSIDDEFDELFYFIKSINKKNSKIINALQLPIIDSMSKYIINGGTFQAFYCTLADNDNIINYELSPFKFYSDFEVLYYECDSFPLCEVNNNTIKNATKLKNINNNYNIGFDKKKLQNKSAISRNHYIILIRCLLRSYEGACFILNNIYSSNYTFYLREGNIDNFFYKYSVKDSKNFVKTVFVEPKEFIGLKYIKIILNVYSGSIEAETINENDKFSFEKYEYNNKQYIFNVIPKNNISDNISDDTTIEFLLKIKPKKNSFYSVIFIIFGRNRYSSDDYIPLPPGTNYLFNFDKEKEQAMLVSSDSDKRAKYLYAGFKAYNCEFNVKFSESGGYLNKTLEVKENYAQDIRYTWLERSFFYYISRANTNKNNTNCLVQVFLYDLEDKEEYDLENKKEIFLQDKESQKFIFNETLNYTRFLYPNVEINNDLNVEIKNPNNANYTLTIFINDKEFQNNTYSINSDKNFIIKKNNWENICKENIIVCAVSFGISLESKENSIFEIIVYPAYDNNSNSNNNSNNNNSNNKLINNSNNKLILYSLIGCGIVVILVVVLILICILKCKPQKDKLTREVNTTSFQEDRLI